MSTYDDQSFGAGLNTFTYLTLPFGGRRIPSAGCKRSETYARSSSNCYAHRLGLLRYAASYHGESSSQNHDREYQRRKRISHQRLSATLPPKTIVPTLCKCLTWKMTIETQYSHRHSDDPATYTLTVDKKNFY